MPTDEEGRRLSDLVHPETDVERFTRWERAYGQRLALVMEGMWQWGERCLHHDGLAVLTFSSPAIAVSVVVAVLAMITGASC